MTTDDNEIGVDQLRVGELYKVSVRINKFSVMYHNNHNKGLLNVYLWDWDLNSAWVRQGFGPSLQLVGFVPHGQVVLFLGAERCLILQRREMNDHHGLFFKVLVLDKVYYLLCEHDTSVGSSWDGYKSVLTPVKP